jgi:hypothetical protein
MNCAYIPITDLLTNEAVRLIENHPTDQPLFLKINHYAPHAVEMNIGHYKLLKKMSTNFWIQ